MITLHGVKVLLVLNILQKKCLVELLTISDQKGARMRATVSEFGPTLLGKMLELNDTQEGILAVFVPVL